MFADNNFRRWEILQTSVDINFHEWPILKNFGEKYFRGNLKKL